MANLRVKKSDLKGTVWVGDGWLCVGGWATKVGDDRRFVSVEATNAAFAGLDVEPIFPKLVTFLESYISKAAALGSWQRTNVLIEGEDGVLTRVYRRTDGGVHCFNEAFLNIIGNPPSMTKVSPNTFVSPAAVLCCTTDGCPEWAKELA